MPMSDNDFLDVDIATEARDASRLIEQRIGELRAAALNSAPASGGHQVGARVPITEPRRQAPMAPPLVQAAPPAPGRALEPGDLTLRSAVYDSQPTNYPEPMTPGRGAPHSSGNTAPLAAAIQRVEHAVQSDVARLEQMLRTWGDPNAATGRLGEQVLSTLQQVEHSMRSDLARVVEGLHTGAADDRMIEAIAAWSSRTEQTISTHTAALRRELVGISERIDAGQEVAVRTAGSSAAIAAAGIGDKLSGALGLLRDPLLDGIDRVQEVAAQVRDNSATVNDGIELIQRSLLRVEGVFEKSRLPEDLLEQISHTITQVEVQLELHAEQADAAAEQLEAAARERLTLIGAQLASTLEQATENLPLLLAPVMAATSGQVGERITGLYTNLERIDESLSRVSGVGKQVDELAINLYGRMQEMGNGLSTDVEQSNAAVVARIDALQQRTQAVDNQVTARFDALAAAADSDATRTSDTLRHLSESIELRHDKLHTELAADLESITQTLLASQDDVPEELTQRFTVAIESLQERLDNQHSDYARDTADAMSSVAAAIVDLRSQHEAEASASRNVVTTELTAMREAMTSELDYNRLQHVRDVEAMMESMTIGWSALFERLGTSDNRLQRLEHRIDDWFAALSDD